MYVVYTGLVTFTSFDALDVTDLMMSLLTSGWWVSKRLVGCEIKACGAHCATRDLVDFSY